MSSYEESNNRNGLEIAIIGMAGRFPGASSVQEFWLNLCGGVEGISFFTDEELDAAGVSAEVRSQPNFIRAGGVLKDIEMFDAAFFGIPPREAEIIDPQQRLFLECAWEALEDAGYDPDAYGGAIGVCAGVGINSYLVNIYSNRDLLESVGSFFTAISNDKDHLTTRVAYKLNLKGPGVTVQTACSTSLVAVHLACQSLLSATCDMVLAGGASIKIPQGTGYIYQEGGIMSPDGHCRAFDSKAQGTVGGNGVGIVVLKRLEDALKDGDNIFAVIKGSAINNDGSSKVGYTAPSIDGQADVIRTAHVMAEIDSSLISYIETHGTGTVFGDPIEVGALNQVFSNGNITNGSKGSCAIGSVKTNIGHLDAAAGVTGLIKATLALKHNMIPPSLHFQEPNPQIDFQNSPFYVNTQLARWETDKLPRRAGVSSFGIGGTNAHVVLEEAPTAEPSTVTRPWQLVVLSARTKSALDKATENLAGYLGEHTQSDLADVAYTLKVGRRAFAHRRVSVCQSAENCAVALQTLDAQRVFTSSEEAKDRPVIFMFPGQGTQHINMGRELFLTEPDFAHHVELCSRLLYPQLNLDISSLIYPDAPSSQQSELQLSETAITQPALFVIEYALAKLWMKWGVRPEAMIGHSIGEYVAACISGVMSPEEALGLVAARGRLMQSLPAGSMLAVALSQKEVEPYFNDRISLAATNGPSMCVISGPAQEIDEAERKLAHAGVMCRRLRTSHAFHSEMMEPILEPFMVEAARVELKAPKIPFISNVTGKWITAAEATDPAYWARHLRQTVRFSEGLSELLKEEFILLETGPGDTLSALARRHPERKENQTILSSMRHANSADSDTAALLTAVGKLWLSGKKINWRTFYAHERRHRVQLPTYPFERQRYWVERAAVSNARPAESTRLTRKRDMADWFYAPIWKQSTLPPSSRRKEAGANCSTLVFMDECELASQLVEQLGCEVTKVFAGDQFARLSDHEYTISPRRREDYDAMMRELQATGSTPTSILHLWSVTRDASESGSNDQAGNVTFDSLLLLAQSIADHIAAPSIRRREPIAPIQMAVISSGLHEVTGRQPLCPAKATLLGPCRVIPQEYPFISCRSIDISLPDSWPDDDEPIASQIIKELALDVSDDVVAYRGSHRWVQDFEPVRLESPDGRSPLLRDRGTYLITGGLGGVGLELAAFLAQEVQARLVLVGRSAFPEREDWRDWLETHGESDEVGRKIRKLQAIEAAGAEILISRADVSDEHQMQAALDEARMRFGAINGVIHAAGVPPSSIIQRKTLEMAHKVLAPKVEGTLILERLLKDENLDFLFLCSSIRSLIGGVGAADYTAANAFLDAFARSRKSRHGRLTASIIWDGWREVGMGSAPVNGHAIEEGLGAGMLPKEGVEAFSRILGSPLAEVVVSMNDLSAVIEQGRAITASNMLEELAGRQMTRSTHPRPDLATPYAEPTNEVESILADIWQRLLGIEKIGIHDNFFELGGDSIISIQIIAKANEAGVRLTPKQVFEAQTIAELVLVAGIGPTIQAEQGLVTGDVPLTPIQSWFFEHDFVEPHHWNQAKLLPIPTRLDAALLKETLGQLLAHHDALRLRFQSDQNGWRQSITGQEENETLSVIDLAGLAEAQQSAAIESLAEQAQASLNLSDGPMLRAVLFDTGPQSPARLLIIVHHLAIDVISWRILIDDLYTVYGQLSRGEQVQLPSKTTSYKQWAESLSHLAQSDDIHQQAHYWLSLPWSSLSPLPLDFADLPNTVSSSQTFSVSLDSALTQALLREVPKVYNTQINDALLAALAMAFAGWSGQRSVLVDMEGHGRHDLFEDLDVSRTVGWFTTIYPVLLSLGEVVDPGGILKSVKEQLRQLPGQGIGFGLLRYLCRNEEISARLRAVPQAEVSFLYLGQTDQAQSGARPALPLETGGSTQSLEGNRPHLLQINGIVSGGELRMSWTYSENLHRRETIEELAQGFMEALRSIITHCLSPGAGGYTPSDLPEADLSQSELDAVLAYLSESDD